MRAGPAKFELAILSLEVPDSWEEGTIDKIDFLINTSGIDWNRAETTCKEAALK
ncbi:MAG: hypothetical protein QMD22_07570 [archaeon]|nr:hypothetical protein [archaeon]